MNTTNVKYKLEKLKKEALMCSNVKTHKNDKMDITVIIPAYNAEKTIERCINSVLTHLPEISIIIINDGSIDNTKDLLEHHYSKYKNIKIIHKSNGGVSSARNVGLEKYKNKIHNFSGL